MQRRVLIIEENGSAPDDPRVWREACALRDNGYAVCVLSRRDEINQGGYELIDGIHVYRHPAPIENNRASGYFLEYTTALFWEFLYSWWIFIRHGFQVIQGCNPPDLIFLVAIPFRLFGVRYVFDHHDVCPELYFAKYGRKDMLFKILVWLERMTFRFSDVVISTNESYREVALNRGLKSSEDVFVVRNGPDLSKAAYAVPDVALKRGKKYLVAYVGEMSVQEGLDILLEAVELLRDRQRTDIHFTCVGKGPSLPELRRLAKEKGLEGMVNFTGWVSEEELWAVLATADVCVNPDRPCEMNDMSTMMKIMDYMAAGKAIVQFKSKEGMFSAQEASLYADPADQVRDFANQIVWLLDRPEERMRMGRFGRKRVEEVLAWKHSTESLLRAYERAFAKKAKGPRVWQWTAQ